MRIAACFKGFPHAFFVAALGTASLTSRTALAYRGGFVLRRSSGGCDRQSGDPFGRVSCPALCLGTASGLLRRPASAKLLLCSRTLPVLAPPFRLPQKSSHSLSGARDNGQNTEKRMYLDRITLIGFIGATPKERPPTQPTSRCSRWLPRRPERTMAGPGNRAPSGIGA